MNPPASDQSPVVLYDGHCGLCQRSVRYLLRHERAPILMFASQTSPYARERLAEHGLPPEPGALIFIRGDTCLSGADAALELCKYLRAPHRWLRAGKIIPRPLRNRLYRWVAEGRYRWFGRTDHCPLPDPAQQQRFFDSAEGKHVDHSPPPR